MKRYPILFVRIFTVVSVAILCFLVVANEVAGVYASQINRFLKAESYITVNKEGDNTDTAYFKSEFSQNSYDEKGLEIYTEEDIDKLIKAEEELGIEMESEGLVLLKNEKIGERNALPLDKGDGVSLFGEGAVLFNYGATGSSEASTKGYADFKAALTDAGLSVNETLWNFYTNGEGAGYRRTASKINEAPWSLISSTESSFSGYKDAAIVVLSRNSGEGSDVPATGTDGANGSYLALSAEETDLLKELTKRKGSVFERLIVILNSSNPIQLDFLDNGEIAVDACLWVGNVGKTGIYAVARALTGDVVPSGKLSDTYVYDSFSSPAMASWALTANKRFAQQYGNYRDFVDGKGDPLLNGTQYFYGVYVEGIYLGYRYYETRYEDVVLGAQNVGDYDYRKVVAYPFGHGLSYATFAYSDYKVTENEDSYTVEVTVTNTSTQYDGKAVVEIYLQKPYDASSGLETASVELAGYAKTGMLGKNGGSETVTVEISKEQFASYDVNANDKAGGYVLEKGDHYLAFGTDAHDALNNILAAKAKNGAAVSSEKMTAEGDAEFVFCSHLGERDETTYSLSQETGNRVRNRLDFADINRYEHRGNNSVTYVSRSDWEGTWPKAAVTLTLNDEMVADLGIHKELPTETEESMPVYGQDSGMSLAMLRSSEGNVIAYDNPAWDTFLDQMTFEQQSMLLSNAAFQTVEMGPPFNKPPTKDNDGPTGVVGSLTGMSFPSEGVWASSFNDQLIERMGELLAEDARYNRTQSLYATGINLHRTPFGGRTHEYFSEDPYLTGRAVSAEVTGMQEKGVIPTLKHFAFNDEEDQRGGVCIWLNEQAARELFLKPFEMAMRPSGANAHGVMTSFNRAGCIWTSASSELMIDIARDEWNFDGYSITDMAESFKYYMTYDDGIMNGTDLYLASGDEYALSDYAYSIPFRLRMRESCHRVLYVICNYSAAMNGVSANSEIVPVTPWWQTTIYAAIGVFAGSTALGTLAWGFYYVLQLKPKKEDRDENQN